MPLDPLWVPEQPGSQLLYDAMSALDEATALVTASTIQSAVDNDRENGRPLLLESGESIITSTLVVDGGSGGGLLGQGRPEPIAQGTANARSGSTLIYNGTKAASEAAIHDERTDFILRDLVLQGKSTADVRNNTGTRTPRGIHLDRSADLGTGKLEIFNVRFSGFDNAIVCGENIADLNCDESHYYSVFSHKNGTFFQARNAQCLGHRFYGFRVDQTDTVFDYKGGGKLSVTGADILSPTTLLHIDGSDPDGFGHNFSKWTFSDIDLDAGARGTRLLTCTTDSLFGSEVVFNKVHLASNAVLPTTFWGNELINVGENMVVRIDNCTDLFAGAIRWNTTSNKSIVHIRSSRVWTDVSAAADLFDTANSTGNLRCIVEMCTQHDTYSLLNSGTLYNEIRTGT